MDRNQRQLRSLLSLQLLEEKQRRQPRKAQENSLRHGILPQTSRCKRRLLHPAFVANHTRQRNREPRMLRLHVNWLPHISTFLFARVKAKGAHRPMGTQPPLGPSYPTRSRNPCSQEAAQGSRSSMSSHQQAAPRQQRLELLAQVLTCHHSSRTPRAQQQPRPRVPSLDCSPRPRQLQPLLRKRPQPLQQRLVVIKKRQPRKRPVLHLRPQRVPTRPHPCAPGQRRRRLFPFPATTPWHRRRQATHPPAALALTALRSCRLCSSCSSTTPSTLCS